MNEGKAKKTTDRFDDIVDTAAQVVGVVGGFGAGVLVTDALYTFIPSEVKLAGKAARYIGGLMIEGLIGDKCTELTQKAADTLKEQRKQIAQNIAEHKAKKEQKPKTDKTVVEATA